MKTSEQINELAAALAKAQPEFEAAGRDHRAKVETKSGGNYEFNYADFAAYLDVCRKPLGDAGLSFVQEAVSSKEEVAVVTRLMHTSGQWIETDPLRLPLIPDSRGAITAQIVGSGVTYAKRYSLSSLIGLASEADDDGNTASGNKAETSQREPLPACPQCGTNKSVIVGKAEFGGGFVCYSKKGGCGAKWQAETEPPKANGKKTEAQKIADTHGMKTGDQVEPPPKSAYQIAIGKIKDCDDVQKVKWLEDWVQKQHKGGHISEGEYLELGGKLVDREDEINAKADVAKAKKEPAAA